MANTNQEYYDLCNLNSYLSKQLIKNGFPNSIHYLKDIASVKVGMFKYKGIEKITNLTSEILETAILFNNFLCFYDVPGVGLSLCRYIVNSQFNEYLKPNYVDLLALNGESLAINVPYKDIILVKDNSLDIIPFITMIEYIRKIEMCDTSVFKVLNVAALPLVLAGNKKIAKQLEALAKKIVGGDSFVAGDDTLMDALKAFDIDLKINPLDIYELKTKYKNECISSIGIYTIEQKKERKIVSEVSSQNEYTDSIYEDERSQRERMVRELNERYGTKYNFNIELVETKRTIAERHINDTIKMTNVGGDNDGNTKTD